MPHTIHNTANNCERALPYTIVSAHCRTQCCAQCRWTFWIAAQEIELFWHTLPHTIHNDSHNCERTLPHTILNCRAGNRIISCPSSSIPTLVGPYSQLWHNLFLCDQTITSSYNCERTMPRTIHNVTHNCNQCDFASSWADALRTHLKTHSG